MTRQLDVTVHEGDLFRSSCAFESDGADVDPTVVYAQWRTPAGTITSKLYDTDPEVIRDSAGNYHIDIAIDKEGSWYVRWYATGNYQAADEAWFTVESSKFV